MLRKSEGVSENSEMREFAHKMVDDMFDYQNKVDLLPTWIKPSKEAKEKFSEKLPINGDELGVIYDDFKKYILPYNQGNIHKNYYGYIQGSGMPLGAMADFLASFMNPNASISDHSARYVDIQVVEWCKTMFNFPKNSSGLIVSGGSMANITAIATAINSYRKEFPNKSFTIYCSEQTHKCLHKGIKTLTGNLDCLRQIPVDKNYQLDIKMLKDQIEKDILDGYSSFLLIGNVGTTNTGSIDDLEELIKIKNEYNLWLHLDGAYGLPALLTKNFKKELELLKFADSLAFDFHKLFNINYDVGCVLIKEETLLSDTFKVEEQAYLMKDLGGIAGGPPTTDFIGFELSRSFKALKIWMIFRNKGLKSLIEMIESRLDLAKYLEKEIKEKYSNIIEITTPVILSIVCFKFIKNWYSKEQMNELHKKIVLEIQESGKAIPSITTINGEVIIRISIVNPKTTKNDIDDLLNEIVKIGKELIL